MFAVLPPKMEFNSISTLTEESLKSLRNDAFQLLVDPTHAESLKLHIYSTFIQNVEDEEEEADEEDDEETDEDEDKAEKQEEKILHFRNLFQYSIEFYPNELALKLSQIIELSSEIPLVRTICITLMHSLLSCCNSNIHVLSPETLIDIREILLYSLQQDFSTSNFPLLSTMVSTVASNVFRFDDNNGIWNEYLDYVAWVLDHHNTELKKGLWLLLDLPLNIKRPRIMDYTQKFQRIILTQLDIHDDEDIWVLAFGSCFKLMFILRSFPADFELVDELCNKVKISVTNLINEEKQVFVQKGLQILGTVVCKELWRFSLYRLKLSFDTIVYIFHDSCITHETKYEVSRLLDLIREVEHMIKSAEFSIK